MKFPESTKKTSAQFHTVLGLSTFFFCWLIMAEKSIDILEIPEVIKPEVLQPDALNVRKYSPGRICISDIAAQASPRYLSAPVGSCHDLCKFGERHTCDKKPWNCSLRRIAEMKVGGQNLEKTETSAERRKVSEACLRSKKITGFQAKKPSEATFRKRETPMPSLSKRKTVSSKQVSFKNAGSMKLKNVRGKTETFAWIRKREFPSLKPIPGSEVKNPDSVTKRHVSSLSKRKSGSSKQAPSHSNPGRLSSFCPPKKGHSSTKGTLLDNSPGVPRSRRKGEYRNGTCSSAQKNLKNMEEFSPLKNQKNVQNPNPRRVYQSTPNNQKNVQHLNSRRIHPSTKKNQKNFRNPKPIYPNSLDVPEKTLYVIESSCEKETVRPFEEGAHPSELSPSSKNKNLEETQNRLHSKDRTDANQIPSSTDDKAYESAKCETNITHSHFFPSSKTEHKTRPKGAATLKFNQKNTAPARKLKFRRGKVIDLQPEDYTPKRLKFRRRVLLDRQKGKGDGQSGNLVLLREAGDGHGRSAPGSEMKLECVLLRPRKEEAKKEARSLFNYVIEETASRLVKSRKSKVRALVGAFETVISLQDTNHH